MLLYEFNMVFIDGLKCFISLTTPSIIIIIIALKLQSHMLSYPHLPISGASYYIGS